MGFLTVGLSVVSGIGLVALLWDADYCIMSAAVVAMVVSGGVWLVQDTCLAGESSLAHSTMECGFVKGQGKWER